MDAIIQVLVLIWIVLFAVTLRWAHVNNRGASIATWLAFTVVTWWVEFAVAFFVIHAILFTIGREAALVALVATIAIFTLTPAAWAYGISHWNRPTLHQ